MFGRHPEPVDSAICFDLATMMTERVPDKPYFTCGPVTVVIHRGNDADDDGADPAIIVGAGDDMLSLVDFCALYNPVKRRFDVHACTVVLLISNYAPKSP